MKKHILLSALLLSVTASAQAENPDMAFVKAAAQGGMAEVKAGQLAVDKASNADVKKFGETLVADHSKANEELKALATEKKIALPAEISAEQKQHCAMLEGLDGAKFDQVFLKHMVEAHGETIAKFKNESTAGKDSEFKKFATETLPTLEAHLKIAKDLAKK